LTERKTIKRTKSPRISKINQQKEVKRETKKWMDGSRMETRKRLAVVSLLVGNEERMKESLAEKEPPEKLNN